MKVLYIVNPISGGKDKSYFVNNINDYCYTYGIEHDFFYTTGVEDVKKIHERVLERQPDRIFSIGGDGTFRIVCSAVKNMNIPVAYIPLGSANGLVKDMPSGDSPWECFEMMMSTHYTRPMDIIDINGLSCLHVADVGVNAQLVKAYEQDKGRGMLTYAKYLWGAVRAQERYRFDITLDGERYHRKGCMLIIANGTSYGSGLKFNAKGNPFDGIFDIIVIKRINLPTLMHAGMPSLYDVDNNDDAFMLSGREATIGISRVTTLQVDGEVGGRFDTLEVKMSDEKVPVLMCRPPKSSW